MLVETTTIHRTFVHKSMCCVATIQHNNNWYGSLTQADTILMKCKLWLHQELNQEHNSFHGEKKSVAGSEGFVGCRC